MKRKNQLTNKTMKIQTNRREFLKHTLLGVNFWKLPGNGPVAGLVRVAISDFCEAVCPSIQLQPQPLVFDEAVHLLTHDVAVPKTSLNNIVLANSFVASQRISTYFRHNAFCKYVQHLFDCEDIHIILIGSLNDQSKKVLYSYHQDARGEYTVTDLMALMSSGQVLYIVTFDTFIAHLASLYNVPLKLFVKSTRRLGVIKDRFVPFSQYFKTHIDHF